MGGESFVTAVADRYDLVKPIGRGGFGVVFEAFDKQRNARVALKKLTHLTPAAAHRLKQEFRALSGVAHRNLVRLFELGSLDGEPFFTMELVDGVDVLSHVWRMGRGAYGPAGTAATESGETAVGYRSARVLPVGTPRPRVDYERLRDVMAQLCDGLAALHAAGKLHRDVKPSNVLVTREGCVVVLDFGIALDMHEEPLRLTDADVVVGTPEYMAPEQGSRQPVGPPADLYAVGVLMFEALTGTLPFPSAGAQVLVDKLHDDAPSVKSIAPDVPDDIATLVDDLLARDPTERPDADEIRMRLGASEAAPKSMLSVRERGAAFIGRASALETLEMALGKSRRGRAQLVRVQGLSGMGKTALLRHFTESLEQRSDVVVLSGRCYEHESVPYKGFDGVIDSLTAFLLRVGDPLASAVVPRDAHMLAQLFPMLSRVPQIATAPRRSLQIPDPRHLRMRAFAALRELFGRLADRMGLVVVIDDVQWGDSDSASLLAELTAAPEPPALLVILSARTERVRSSSQIRALLDPDRAFAPDNHLVLVDALPEPEAALLARSLLGPATEDAIVEKVARESAGSPFFIGELSRFVQSSHMPLEDIRLERVLGARVSVLPPPERALLHVLSIADRPVSESAAFAAAKLAHDDGRGAVSALRAAHLIRTSGGRSDRLEPYHDRVRETVIATIDDDGLRKLHRSLFDAVAGSSSGDPELLFSHSRGAGLSEQAIAYAQAAAKKAEAALAFERAAFYYAQALELAKRPDQRRKLGQKLADALASAGHGIDAADAYLAALRGASREESIAWRSRASELLLLAGRIDRGRAIALDVANDVGLSIPTARWVALLSLMWLRLCIFLRGFSFAERAERDVDPRELSRLAVNWSVAYGLAVVDNTVSMVLSARYLLNALHAGEPTRVARGMVLWAGFIGRQGGRAAVRGQGLLSRAEPLVLRSGAPELRAHLAWGRAWIAYFTGHFAQARAELTESMRIFRDECAGASWEVATTELFELYSLVYLGQLEEFAKLHPRYMREADERGDRYLAAALRASFNIVAWLIRDEPAAARTAIAHGIAAWPRDGFQAQHWWELQASAWVDLYDDDSERALSRMLEGWPKLSRSLMLHLQLVRIEAAWIRGTAAAAASRGSQESPHLERARHDVEAIRREQMPWGDALALLLEGAIAMRAQSADEACRALDAAALHLDRAGLAMHAAFAKRRAGILAGASGTKSVEDAEAWLRDRGVVDAERMGRVFGV